MANKKQNNLQVATLGGTVRDALTALKEELAGLKVISETQYKTGSDGRVAPFPKTIQEETDIATLIQMHSSVNGRSKAYDDSLVRLSEVAGAPISAPVFKVNGATLEAIESDIALRIKVLNIKERKEELEKLLKEAEGFLTEKDKFKMFQARLAASLGIEASAVEEEE